MPSLTKIQTGFLEPQGAFELTPGTSSSPGLFFTGDTSTGMFSPSSGVLGFSTGSTQQALTILANGNVGIGTDNPAYKLHVEGGAYINDGALEISDGASPTLWLDAQDSNWPAIIFKGTPVGGSAGTQMGSVGFGGLTNQELEIWSTGTVALKSTSYSSTDGLFVNNNNVGIGTDNPVTLLDVRGGNESAITVGTTSQLYGRLYGSPTLTFVGAYNGADLSFSTSSSTSYSSKMMIKNGGNVGIGTDNPSSLLHLYTTSPWGTATNDVFTFNNDGFNGNTALKHNLGRIRWRTNSVDAAAIEAIRTLPAGGNGTSIVFSTNVGGNTSTTTERLCINPDGTVSLGIIDTDSNATLHIRSPKSSETTRLELSTYDTYTGSIPDADIVFTQQNGTELAKIQCDTNTGAANMADLVFHANFGGLYERLRVDKNGELSISGSRSGQSISDAILKFNIVNSNGDGKKAEIKAIKTADITSELMFSTTVSHTFAERMRIGSTGCLNIGGNFTQTDYTAQVTRHTGNTDVMQIKGNVGNSFIRFTDSDASSDYSLGADDAISDGFILYDRNASTYRIVVTDTGNVGIGNNTPAEKLDVYGSIRSLETGPGNGLLLHTNCGLTASANLMQIWTGQSSGISFHTNSASGDGSNERLRINGSGNVGIGTNNPQALLQLGSRTSASPQGNLHIVRGEAISGGTGPSLSLIHGPDGSTQRSHQIYSYVGNLRIYADAAENLELSGSTTILRDANRTARFYQSAGTFYGLNNGDYFLSKPQYVNSFALTGMTTTAGTWFTIIPSATLNGGLYLIACTYTQNGGPYHHKAAATFYVSSKNSASPNSNVTEGGIQHSHVGGNYLMEFQETAGSSHIIAGVRVRFNYALSASAGTLYGFAYRIGH